jgi:hypothetical protein
MVIGTFLIGFGGLHVFGEQLTPLARRNSNQSELQEEHESLKALPFPLPSAGFALAEPKQSVETIIAQRTVDIFLVILNRMATSKG